MVMTAIYVYNKQVFNAVIPENIEHEYWSNLQDSQELKIVLNSTKETQDFIVEYVTDAEELKALKITNYSYVIFWR